MKNIILDCDPGHDDAIAILLAANSELINLLAITVSAGNQSIEKTTLNALSLAEYFNLDIKVAKGLDTPIVAKSQICPSIHGETGLDGFDFFKLNKKIDDLSAPLLIISMLENYKDVTLVVTGPLTNLAIALKLKPSIINSIEEIVVMGGAMEHGNVTPAAEFNILCDPEAAHIVFNCGAIVKMVGLDVTRKVRVNRELIEEVKEYKTKSSKLFVDLMDVFLENQLKTFGLDAPLHDPVTIATLIDESIVTFEKMNVGVDMSHGTSYGRTNCDRFNYLEKEKNVFVATKIDANKFFALIKSSLRKY